MSEVLDEITKLRNALHDAEEQVQYLKERLTRHLELRRSSERQCDRIRSWWLDDNRTAAKRAWRDTIIALGLADVLEDAHEREHWSPVMSVVVSIRAQHTPWRPPLG